MRESNHTYNEFDPDQPEGPAFGITPITSEAIHDWLENGKAAEEPDYSLPPRHEEPDESVLVSPKDWLEMKKRIVDQAPGSLPEAPIALTAAEFAEIRESKDPQIRQAFMDRYDLLEPWSAWVNVDGTKGPILIDTSKESFGQIQDGRPRA